MGLKLAVKLRKALQVYYKSSPQSRKIWGAGTRKIRTNNWLRETQSEKVERMEGILGMPVYDFPPQSYPSAKKFVIIQIRPGLSYLQEESSTSVVGDKHPAEQKKYYSQCA